MPLSPAGVTATSFSTGLIAQSNPLQQPAGSMAQQAIIAQAGPEGSLVPQATDPENERGLIPWLTPAATDQMPVLDPIQQPATTAAKPAIYSQTDHEHSLVPQPTNRVLDYVLDELAADSVLVRMRKANETVGSWSLHSPGVLDTEAEPGATPLIEPGLAPDSTGPVPWQGPPRQSAAHKAWLTDILLAAGFCSFGAGLLAAGNRKAGSPDRKRKPLEIKLIPGR